jgi:hypothetical protein
MKYLKQIIHFLRALGIYKTEFIHPHHELLKHLAHFSKISANFAA